MKETITDLWNGNIAPCEHCGAHDVELNRMIGVIERNRSALCAELGEGQEAVFQKYLDCSEEYLLRLMELAFQDGFGLGARLVMEVLL